MISSGDETAPEHIDPASSDAQNDLEEWIVAIERALSAPNRQPLSVAKQALRLFPDEPMVLHLAGLAALLEKKPKEYLSLDKRLRRHYDPVLADHLLMAIYHAQSGRWSLAATTLQKHRLTKVRASQVASVFWKHCNKLSWTRSWLDAIQRGGKPPVKPSSAKSASSAKKPTRSDSTSAPSSKASSPPATQDPQDALLQDFPELPKLDVRIPIRFDLPDHAIPRFPNTLSGETDMTWFALRTELNHLGLLQGFSELLCLSQIQNVDTYWYQVESVRKVLKQFRGRVLLADEVGLGKTIEAGMVLKEYVLRGMAKRILILTPPSLVGQWQEEMAVKFAISCVTTQSPDFRADPDTFWQEPRIIASLAVARREEHVQRLNSHRFDLVIVDEAHHLRNRTTRNWKLVDGLNKRFLILLTATPVQNTLLELYNLLTLLKPGIFRTEKEFRAQHVSPRNPRVPKHPDRLRELMRDVMIRNTRALVDVRLPPRHAVTMRVTGEADEIACYQTLSHLIRDQHAQGMSPLRKMSFHHLLTAAGSSPLAVTASLERFIAKHPGQPTWQALFKRYQTMTEGGKAKALLDLLKRNPQEKKLVFIHHRATMAGISQFLDRANLSHARFEGGMTGLAKDAAVKAFQDEVPILLCSESGGEGRNLQFCNTLINFDLPWSPMTIEQRIGRIHRIGQTREVFIFNLALRDTVEDRLLTLLDEKLNLFELVVGEVGAILGEMDETNEFSETIYAAWVEVTEEGRHAAFMALGDQLQGARTRHETVKVLDEHLFGDEFETG